MKALSIESMTECHGGNKLSSDCIKALVAEGLSYTSLFLVTSVASGGLAIAGLVVSAIMLGFACSNE